jgi:glycine cleavage system H protein
MALPTDRRYTSDHEWVLLEADVATIGITDYAAEKLGDVVYVDLPAAQTEIAAGEVVGEIESTKSVGELFAPLAGTVLEVNEDVVSAPETVNSDPFGAGWLVKLLVADTSSADALLDAAGYGELIGLGA